MENSYTLRITGLAELAEPVLIDSSYTFTLTADIVGIDKRSNDDGGFTYIHKAKLLTAQMIDAHGKIIKIKDTKKQSVKLRGQIHALDLDYDDTMTKLRHYLVEVLEYIKTLDH